jgi:5-hydroxyisourate hydrolase
MGRLTTHVLDTALGRPAAGLRIQLFKLGSAGDAPEQIVETVTNDDGRCDAPLLNEDVFGVGRYELVFDAGDYLRRSGAGVSDPAFLDDVVIRFGISDADSHYHVPLLLSAYGYSTYRGS